MDLGWSWCQGPDRLVGECSRIQQPIRAFFFIVLLSIGWSLGLSCLTKALAQESNRRIQSIDIEGNQHIEKSAIRDKITLNIGDMFTVESTRNQIQKIYAMGFFEDVQVHSNVVPQGIKVTFQVREKPFNVEVVFDGNENLTEDKLKEKTTVRSQVFLDNEQVQVSGENIRQAYQEDGYYNAQIVPIIETIEENRSRLTFFIKEGSQANIQSLKFEGRNVARRKDLLDTMANREYSRPWSWFSDAGKLRKDELSNDVERIKEVYMNKGYLDIQVGIPNVELDEKKEWFSVTFPIEEGEPYTVSRVRFNDITVFEDEELRLGLTIHPNEVFQRAKVREEITRLTDMYGEKGYAFAEVVPAILPDPATRTTEIAFTIKEGELIRVREIRITGNDKTRDNVIRRELRVDERAMIDSVAMKRSFERLNNLNYFETVEILPDQVNDTEVDLDVKVKEKPTGSFSIGGGFSTLDQFTAIADITEGNLFGLGYLVKVRGQLGGRRTLGVLTFRNPAIFDSVTSMQLDGFSTRTNFLTYVEDKFGGNFTFGRAFSEFISGSFTFVGEDILIKDVADDAPEFIVDQIGRQSTTGFRATLTRDSRDFFLDPRKGVRLGMRGSFGTQALGGTNNFYSVAFDALKFTPIPFWDLRHAIRGRVGIGEGFGGRPFPLAELFFVGGINTVRGFQFGRAGPVTSSGTLEGGNKQLILNNELIFPVLPDAKLNGVIFFDYGKGFEEGQDLSLDLRSAAGLEVRWISPFGPLRAAWGVNLDPRPQERRTVFEFSVGSVF